MSGWKRPIDPKWMKLTKYQLARRLEYLDFVLTHLKKTYEEYASRPSAVPLGNDYDRGMVSGMKTALEFLNKDPDQEDDEKEGSTNVADKKTD